MYLDKLKGKMAEKRYTQNRLAKELDITPQAINAKLNGRSQFNLGEVIQMISILSIENPSEIFFDNTVPNKQRKIKH